MCIGDEHASAFVMICNVGRYNVPAHTGLSSYHQACHVAISH